MYMIIFRILLIVKIVIKYPADKISIAGMIYVVVNFSIVCAICAGRQYIHIHAVAKFLMKTSLLPRY